MDKSKPRRCALLIAVMLAFGSWGSGCQKSGKQLRAEPKGDEIVTHSNAMLVEGSEVTALFQAPSSEIAAFLLDPGNWQATGTDAGASPDQRADQLEAPLLGNSFPFEVSIAGKKVSGRLVVIKSTDKAVWFLWANGKVFHLQRWSFAEAAGNTLVSLRFYTQTEENGEYANEETAGILSRRLDGMLALLDARFNHKPGTKKTSPMTPKRESFTSIIQTCESAAWIAASPQAIMEYGLSPKNVEGVGGMKYDQERVTRNGIGYAPISARLVTLDLKMDTFFMDLSQEENQFVTYFVFRDWVGFMKTVAISQDSGSRTRQIVAVEIPGASPSLMDLLYAIMGLPSRLEQSMVNLKTALEKKQ